MITIPHRMDYMPYWRGCIGIEKLKWDQLAPGIKGKCITFRFLQPDLQKCQQRRALCPTQILSYAG